MKSKTTAQADKILRRAGYGTHGQKLRGKNAYLLRRGKKRANFRRKTKKKAWRSFEARLEPLDSQHLQSIRDELRNGH